MIIILLWFNIRLQLTKKTTQVVFYNSVLWKWIVKTLSTGLLVLELHKHYFIGKRSFNTNCWTILSGERKNISSERAYKYNIFNWLAQIADQSKRHKKKFSTLKSLKFPISNGFILQFISSMNKHISRCICLITCDIKTHLGDSHYKKNQRQRQ